MPPLTTMLLVVIGVAALAWLMRRTSKPETIDRDLLSGRAPEPEEHRMDAPGPIGEDADDEDPDAVAAVSSDGLTFVPFDNGVELILAGQPEEMEAHLARRAQGGSAAGMLSRGDLLGARVVRGAPGVDPWRLEALGRDHEYLAWSFETEEAARAALEMLEHSVVKAPPDEDGEPAPPGAAEFEEARRVHDETAEAVAAMPETEEPEEPRS